MTAPSGKRSVSVEHAVAYGLLTAIGLLALVTAIGYGLFKEGARVGPGLVPAVVGAGIALIGGWEFIGTLRGRRDDHTHGLAEVAASVTSNTAAPAATAGAVVADTAGGGGSATPGAADDDDVDIYGRTSATRGRQLWIVFGALVVTVLLVPVLGFLGAFFVLSVFISAVVERRAWLPSVVISLVAVVIVWAVFAQFLNVPLPDGLIGIGG
ncbi:tripartite tricarboxylate transporter TctB family protein [Blastococcus capsensis]|uniref:tripartite tricarboxylate transporter TctB family protein n=1 Tax=Blastococcus capsensis TaxID=1564163 RepID=UPI002540C32B|nr:tripartite tricarboxylate transporter TctB family protein [Blastococcus capsensis]MDK3255027.1 tripartite tricarboxylate transporter TctB family protein [Blastococcus capsensis]